MKVVKIIDTAFALSFKPDKKNLVLSMMSENFFHFHYIPRYYKPVQFNGRNWTDSFWPFFPSFEIVSEDSEVNIRWRVKEVLREVIDGGK